MSRPSAPAALSATTAHQSHIPGAKHGQPHVGRGEDDGAHDAGDHVLRLGAVLGNRLGGGPEEAAGVEHAALGGRVDLGHEDALGTLDLGLRRLGRLGEGALQNLGVLAPLQAVILLRVGDTFGCHCGGQLRAGRCGAGQGFACGRAWRSGGQMLGPVLELCVGRP